MAIILCLVLKRKSPIGLSATMTNPMTPTKPSESRTSRANINIAKYGKPRLVELSEYKIWLCMKDRCYREKNKRFKRYGGRGIKVCKRWLHSFDNFYKDVGARPSFEFTLDRIDNDGDYKPSNCRWATRDQQRMNSSRTIVFKIKDKIFSQKEFAKYLGVDPRAIKKLRQMGYSTEKIHNHFKGINNG